MIEGCRYEEGEVLFVGCAKNTKLCNDIQGLRGGGASAATILMDPDRSKCAATRKAKLYSSVA